MGAQENMTSESVASLDVTISLRSQMARHCAGHARLLSRSACYRKVANKNFIKHSTYQAEGDLVGDSLQMPRGVPDPT